MEKCAITFRSVTRAQRAELMLGRAGIRCVLGRTPKAWASRGCSYCLWIRSDRSQQAAEQLERAGMEYDRLVMPEEVERL